MEQARKATNLARLVLFATLHDQVVGVLAGNNVFCAVGRRTQHAHGMVVAQHHIFDGLVGDLTNTADHVLRHHRRGLGVNHHHRVIADHDARVGVALGGVGPSMLGQLLERDVFDFRICVAGKGFGVHGVGFLGLVNLFLANQFGLVELIVRLKFVFVESIC